MHAMRQLRLPCLHVRSPRDKTLTSFANVRQLDAETLTGTCILLCMQLYA